MVEAYYFEHQQQNEALTEALLDNRSVLSLIAISDENTGFGNYQSTSALREIAENSNQTYILFLSPELVEISASAIDRMITIASESNAGFVYGDYHKIQDQQRIAVPLTDYQLGSVRDSFDFGPAILIKTSLITDFTTTATNDYLFSGWYALRLFIATNAKIIHIPEFLSAGESGDLRKSGEKQFDYLNSAKIEIQLEMERAFTTWAQQTGLCLPQRTQRCIDTENHSVVASVIIPVKNRVKTIADAVNSALAQHTNFLFNVIVIDNHSTDGTTELLANLAKDKRIVHLVPPDKHRGIGGCWHYAVDYKKCGKYAVQLDSDDLYLDQNCLSKIVDLFEKENYAMVVGSYKLVDFSLNEIPPGIIDHKEWTNENGHNNLLRINGMGAPRAFSKLALQNISIPDVSYGEDYAMALQITRQYAVGRIYEPLYLCRRWEDNSDADLKPEVVNKHNAYKDFLRTNEIEARLELNKKHANNG